MAHNEYAKISQNFGVKVVCSNAGFRMGFLWFS